MRTTFAAISLAVVSLAEPAVALPASFTVKPTSITLTASATSTLVTVTNTSNRPLRFEVRAMKWVQDERGELVLTRVEKEITVTPALLTLEPGASRNVRVGAPASAFGAVEGTYRVFVEELQDTSKPRDAGTVALRLEIGVPVFLAPSRPASSAQIAAVAFEQGRLVTRVRNTGNVHMVINAVKIQGTDAAGGVKYDRTLEGWYVLAGDTRVFEQPVTPAECAGVRNMAVTVDIRGTALKGQVPIPAGACGATGAR